MSDDVEKSKISQVLERLQEESWQLELLISGFAIFLVASSWEPLEQMLTSVAVTSRGLESNNVFQAPAYILVGMWIFLLVNLIIHVILRGFWISAIGLRYISGDIDFDRLRLAPKFDRFLRRRMPSFDLFIEKLEKICSVVFAFTFLILFVLFSIGSFIVLMSLFNNVAVPFLENTFNEGVAQTIQNVVMFTMLISALLYFIDFITLGWIKRIKWLSHVYYPIYRVFSIITFSFIYRPLYYNLIDDKFGRKVGLLIFPYIFITLLLTSMHTDAFLYYPDSHTTNVELMDFHYLDNYEERDRIKNTCIPSKFIDKDFLEVFIPYTSRIDKVVEKICPDIKPDKTLGVKFAMITINGGDEDFSPPDSLLTCVAAVYKLSIDSIRQTENFMFYTHKNEGEAGLLSIIDIDTLQRGKHLLQIEAARTNSGSDSLWYAPIRDIPFWKQ